MAMRTLLSLVIGLSVLLGWVGEVAATARARVTRFQALKAICLEGETLRVLVLPERGANLISLFDKRTRREWIWQNPWDRYRKVRYASSFLDADVSGFDDCFPTVGQQAYPAAPWKGVVIPDHGELWSLPWSYQIRGGSVRLWVRGRRLPYRFEKQIRLVDPGRVEISYQVTNLSDHPLEAIWAAHALVAVRPGMDVFLPEEARFQEDLSPWSLDRRFGLGWIRLGGPETKSCKKAFTERLTEGWGGFYDGTTGDFLLYTFPVAKVPYLGLWINQGGLVARGHRHYNVGLEPTNGGEEFQHSRQRGMQHVIPARATETWYLHLTCGKSTRRDLRARVRQAR
ncbi:MAG: hypothetical protein GX774_16940 [Armatimonadetes bacterium]|nr:hypothetical protein [Armatimonadota bacterium]